MNDEEMTPGAIKYIVSLIVENANEAREDARKNKGDAYYEAKKLAYYEVLDTIKNQLIGHNQNLAEYGLDINLDKEYL